MGCEGCIEKTRDNEREETYKKALALANETGEWIAILHDGTIIRAGLAVGYPIKEYVTPKLHNTSL